MSSSGMTQLSLGLIDTLTKLELGKKEINEEYAILLNSYTLLLKSMSLMLGKIEKEKNETMHVAHKNQELKNNLHYIKSLALGLSLNRPC
jgi:hypothetical protein